MRNMLGPKAVKKTYVAYLPLGKSGLTSARPARSTCRLVVNLLQEVDRLTTQSIFDFGQEFLGEIQIDKNIQVALADLLLNIVSPDVKVPSTQSQKAVSQ